MMKRLVLLTGNQTDFAILPVTLAANLYANQQDLMLVGVHEWKVFYLLARQGLSSLTGPR